MSVAQQSIAEQITYDDLYRRWEEGNWKADELDFTQDRRAGSPLTEIQRKLRPVDLLDVLLRRGRGHRRPLPLHRGRPQGGAEVLPRHPAGRRGPPRRLLPPLLQGGHRRRGRHRRPASSSPPPQLGWGYRNVFGRLERMVDELHTRPLPPQVRAGDHPLPHGHRGDDGAARPALHRGLLRQGGHDARASARGWRRSRATSSATSASASRCSRSSSRSPRSARPPSPSSCARSSPT